MERKNADASGIKNRINVIDVLILLIVIACVAGLVVRFGNVFGSSGSVVELWREQIATRSAVTVTDSRMTRYFMSVQEAVSLVLNAASYDTGKIYTLDMGEPKRILKLAEEMIKEAGWRPYKDIPIVFTGMRPGEKLEEELGLEHGVRIHGTKIFACEGELDA